jgi:hypothetical protein
MRLVRRPEAPRCVELIRAAVPRAGSPDSACGLSRAAVNSVATSASINSRSRRPGGNSNAPTIMIAEAAADLIRGRAPTGASTSTAQAAARRSCCCTASAPLADLAPGDRPPRRQLRRARMRLVREHLHAANCVSTRLLLGSLHASGALAARVIAPRDSDAARAPRCQGIVDDV